MALGSKLPPPRLREWIVIALVMGATIVFLPILVRRVVTHGLGDVQVYFRAAWAVWTGHSLYDVTDHHGWHFHYPPSFALLMGPFAHPLPDSPLPAWALPLPAAVAVWYVINVVAVFASVHVWASALERHAHLEIRPGYWDPAWMLRLGPLLALLPFIGSDLSSGQPTTILILLLSGFLILYSEDRPNGAAALLALATAIKIFPAVLALIPILRRDWRWMVYFAAWCAVCLIIFPIVCVGPQATVELYRALWTERLEGLITGAVNTKISAELSPWAADFSNIGSTLARVVEGREGSWPEPLPPWATRTQSAANVAFVVILAWLGHGRFWRLSSKQPLRPYPVLVAGALLLAVWPAMSPVSQPHYWILALPLVGVMVAEGWRRTGLATVSPALFIWSAAAWFAMISNSIPLWRPLRLLGLQLPVFSLIIIAGIVVLAKLDRGRPGATAA